LDVGVLGLRCAAGMGSPEVPTRPIEFRVWAAEARAWGRGVVRH